MPTPSSEHASTARESTRRLAHTTRSITDPTEIYDLVGTLSLSITSLAQSLHQIAKVHDRLDPGRARVAESARSGRATSYAVSWELHRAAEILIQAASGLDRAHQDEARIAYGPPEQALSATNNAAPAASAGHLLR